MNDIICQAVADAFDSEDFGCALVDRIADAIDYDAIAEDLLRRASVQDAVHDAALAIAEDLL